MRTVMSTTQIKKLHDLAKSGDFEDIELATDEKVIARITDGIYRQPGSAIRELLANAYDADAT